MSIRRQKRTRGSRGALAAEYVATLYLLFLFLFFPLLNLGVAYLRCFFLWFAANQGAMAACKATAFDQNIVIGGTTHNSALAQADAAIAQVHTAFPGWDMTTAGQLANIYIYAPPIPNTAGVLVQGANRAALAAPINLNTNVPMIVVQVPGQTYPIFPMTLGGMVVQGLSTPMPFTATAQAIFENPSGLTL